ncbi:MAG: flagellin lysine-N-methylase [Desulfosporosinus sp.]|nr:flagellin lysine-N-methylase [Desulfosporosinus sp.]
MTKITREIQMPLYLKSFNCIGSACEDSCCFGWSSITVDSKTFKKYSKIHDPALKEIFDNKVVLNQTEQSEETYARVILNNDSTCPFLTEKKLCLIQLQQDENYLPKICFAFPRVTNVINGILEKSAVMSCPEAVRVALLNSKGIDFISVQEPLDVRNSISISLNTNDPAFTDTPNKYFQDLRNYTLFILMNRDYKLEERLIILGLFFQKLAKVCSEKKVDTIPELIASFAKLLKKESLIAFLAKTPTSPVVQFKLLMQSALIRLVQGITNQRYAECFIEFLQGIKHSPNVSSDILAENYRLAFENYYAPFAFKHEYIFENYLVNYVYNNLFPLCNGDIFDEYIKLVFHYSLIKMLLIGIAGFHQGLSQELLVKLIQSFAKTIEHNHQYINETKDWFKRKGLNSMSYLSILIKN